MKRAGPLRTLLAGLVLGLFMLSLNATTGTRAAPSGDGAPSGGGAPATGAVPAAPSPGASSRTPSASAPASPSPTPSATRAAPPPDADYAGRTEDDSASVAVAVRDDEALAYFCDGRAREAWLRGTVGADGALELTGKEGHRLDGVLAGDRAEGTVGIDGRRWKFTARRAEKPSGLYRATAEVRGAEIVGGWIVQQDGGQVGVVTRDGKPSPAPEIDPDSGSVTVDGAELTARPAAP